MKNDNLKRIRGVLSAKKGAEIPKFGNGAKFKADLNGTTLYSEEGTVWYTDLTLTTLHSDLSPEDLAYLQNNKLPLLEIVGGNSDEGNPNASLDQAAKVTTVVNTDTEISEAKQRRQERKANRTVVLDSGLTKNQTERINRIRDNGNTARADRVEARVKARNEDKAEFINAEAQQAADISAGAINAVGNAFKANNAANNSDETNAIDSGVGAISSTMSSMGGVAGVIGDIIGIADSAGQIIRGITGETDLMTGADKFFDSGIGTILGGFINLLGAQKSDAFATDVEALETVGSSYGGTSHDISEAARKADKKYGLFSSGARRKANEAAKKVAAIQNTMADVADTARDLRLAAQSMGEQAGLAYSIMTDGGYSQKYTYAAKHGGILEHDLALDWQPQIELNWELPIFQEGGNIDFAEELDWVPVFKDGRTLELLIQYAKTLNPRFIQRLSEKRKGIEFTDENGNKVYGSHVLSFATDELGAIVYPRIQEMENGELKYFENWKEAFLRAVANNNILRMTPEEAKLFTESGEDENGNLFGYKVGWPEFFFPEDLSEYPEEYRKFKLSLPDNQKFTPESEYRTYLYWQLWGKPKDFKYTETHPNEDGDYMYNLNKSDGKYHASSVAWGDGIGYFMKPKHHSTVGYELDWYNKGLITEEGGKQREMTPEERKLWEDFRAGYELVDDGDFYKYVPKNKEGGSLGNSDIPEIEETNQKNVIPEGALHKNKHHMEHAEGLTKKGIPVIDELGEQQAEIEHSEIIFTLEVTKKLEEYYEIFYSEDSTNKEKEQAALDTGKLLVYQILENTEDRTGLIESCKKGGTLNFKKDTELLIEEVLEWMPTVVIVETEELEEKKEEKSNKKLALDSKEELKLMIKLVLVEMLI